MQTKLQIGGFTFDLIFDDPMKYAPEEFSEKLDVLYGLLLFHERKVIINPNFPKDAQFHALLHEIVHIIGYLIGNSKLRESTLQNEYFVDALSAHLTLIMLQNKDIFRLFLKEGESGNAD